MHPLCIPSGLYIILFMAIPCVGILMLQISNKKCPQNTVVLHQIDSGLSYFAFYMQSWHIWTTDNDFRGCMVPVIVVPCIQVAVCSSKMICL
jgi:hypothetical protein